MLQDIYARISVQDGCSHGLQNSCETKLGMGLMRTLSAVLLIVLLNFVNFYVMSKSFAMCCPKLTADHFMVWFCMRILFYFRHACPIASGVHITGNRQLQTCNLGWHRTTQIFNSPWVATSRLTANYLLRCTQCRLSCLNIRVKQNQLSCIRNTKPYAMVWLCS